MTLRGRILWLTVLVCGLHPSRAHAQAEYAGKEPGSYISAGATVSGFTSGYGEQKVSGITAYLDANLYRRVGAEVAARTLRFHTQEDLRQSTYLIGPRFSTHGRNLRPYSRLLVGRGYMTFPFGYAHGSYFVVAPGVGLDWRIPHSRVQVRVFDFEYQDWPNFTFGPMHTWGVSSGLSLRLF